MLHQQQMLLLLLLASHPTSKNDHVIIDTDACVHVRDDDATGAGLLLAATMPTRMQVYTSDKFEGYTVNKLPLYRVFANYLLGRFNLFVSFCFPRYFE